MIYLINRLNINKSRYRKEKNRNHLAFVTKPSDLHVQCRIKNDSIKQNVIKNGNPVS